MAKPLGTVIENIIYVMMEKGPVTVADIKKEIQSDQKTQQLSAQVSQVWFALGDDREGTGVLRRAKPPGSIAFTYQRAVDNKTTVEEALGMFRDYQKRYRSRMAPDVAETLGMNDPAGESPPPVSGKGPVEAVVGQIIELRVTGRIDVVFKVG